MLTLIESFFRDGKVELKEPVPEGLSGRVIVTFVPDPQVRFLKDLGIDRVQAADLHARLSAFAEDWDRPEMDVYDAN
jgi:hypothetical protein